MVRQCRLSLRVVNTRRVLRPVAQNKFLHLIFSPSAADAFLLTMCPPPFYDSIFYPYVPPKCPLFSGLFHYFPKTRFCRLTSDSQKNDVKNDVRISAENPRNLRRFPRRPHRANMACKHHLSPSSLRCLPYMPVCLFRERRGYRGLLRMCDGE